MKKAILATIILLITLVFIGVKLANDWFSTHFFQFNQPIMVALNTPVEIKKREPQIIEKKILLDYPDEIKTPIEKYICDKFGTYECKTALAVSSAENGTRQPDRFNINTNGTIDVGLFQINSIHFKKEGCSLKEIVDPYKNVDCAYKIWQSSGWSAWVAFNNKNYLSKL